MSNRKIDPAEIHFDENTAVEVADLENEEYYVEGERLTEESAQRLAAEMLEESAPRTSDRAANRCPAETSTHPSCRCAYPSSRATSSRRSRTPVA